MKGDMFKLNSQYLGVFPEKEVGMARKTLGLRRNLKEEMRRESITRAAVKLFSTQGYEQSSMDDIVAEAGCSKSLVYWYWKNKADLFSHLIDLCMTPYLDLLNGILESRDPYLIKLNRLFWDFAELYNNNDRMNKIVHFGSLHSARQPEENFKEKVNGYYQEVLERLERIFLQGVESGHLRKDTDVSAIAYFLLASVEGHIYMSMLQDRMPVERSLVAMMSRYFLPRILEEDSGGGERAGRKKGKK